MAVRGRLPGKLGLDAISSSEGGNGALVSGSVPPKPLCHAAFFKERRVGCPAPWRGAHTCPFGERPVKMERRYSKLGRNAPSLVMCPVHLLGGKLGGNIGGRVRTPQENRTCTREPSCVHVYSLSPDHFLFFPRGERYKQDVNEFRLDEALYWVPIGLRGVGCRAEGERQGRLCLASERELIKQE